MSPRRTAATTGVVLGLGLALVGCSDTATAPGGQGGGGDAGTLTITGFSGAFADQFQEEVIDPFTSETGIQVRYTPSTNSAEMLANLRANSSRPTYDLVIIDSSVAITANAEGLFSEVDPAQVPSYDSLIPEAVVQDGYGPAITIDSLAYVYNPSLLDAAPTTWTGLDDDAYDGQIALQIADTRGIALIAGLSQEMGLDYETDGIDAQLGVLADIAPKVQTFQPQPNLYDAIRSGSAEIGVGWNARAQDLSNQTPDEMAVSVPADAGVAQINTLNLVATSEQTELAEQFMEYAIGVDAQTRLATEAYYGPVNSQVELPDDVRARVAVDGGLLTDAAPIDWAWIAPHYSEWVERIQREVIGG